MAACTLIAMRSVGENIREQRNRLGMTQEELGALTRFGVTRISDLERNRYRQPDTKTLVALAQALGCSIDDLLFGPEEEYRKLVAEWPIFQYLRERFSELQPYPDTAKWKTVMAAYERAITRATMLCAAVVQIHDLIGAKRDLDWGELLIPETVDGMGIPEQGERRDLIRHAGTEPSGLPNSRGEAAGGESDQARIRELEDRVAGYRTIVDRLREALGEVGEAAQPREESVALAKRPARRGARRRRARR